MTDKSDIITALHRVGFGSRHFDSVWPDSQLDLLNPVKAVEGCNSVMLSGVLGGGKTSLLSCFCQELFKSFAVSANGVEPHVKPILFASRAIYVTHTELSKVWEREFSDDPVGSEDEFYKAPILFLDDLGTAPDTASGRNIARLEGLIDWRWRNKMKTFIASNISLKDLERPLNAQWHRMARRLADNEWMVYRELKKKYGGK